MDPNNVSWAPKPVEGAQAPQDLSSQPPSPTDASPAPQSPEQPMAQQRQQDTTDVFGIISLVTIFVGFQFVGVILGYLGMKKAKKEGYSPILSQIGFWVNLVISVLVALWIGFMILTIFISATGSK